MYIFFLSLLVLKKSFCSSFYHILSLFLFHFLSLSLTCSLSFKVLWILCIGHAKKVASHLNPSVFAEMTRTEELIVEEAVEDGASSPCPVEEDKYRPGLCVSKSLSSGESWGSEEGREYRSKRQLSDHGQSDSRNTEDSCQSDSCPPGKSEDECGSPRTIWRFQSPEDGLRRKEDWRTYTNSWEADKISLDEDKVPKKHVKTDKGNIPPTKKTSKTASKKYSKITFKYWFKKKYKKNTSIKYPQLGFLFFSFFLQILRYFNTKVEGFKILV